MYTCLYTDVLFRATEIILSFGLRLSRVFQSGLLFENIFFAFTFSKDCSS